MSTAPYKRVEGVINVGDKFMVEKVATGSSPDDFELQALSGAVGRGQNEACALANAIYVNYGITLQPSDAVRQSINKKGEGTVVRYHIPSRQWKEGQRSRDGKRVMVIVDKMPKRRYLDPAAAQL